MRVDWEKMSFQARVKGFFYALRGLRVMVLTQPHAWIITGATAVVVIAGLLLHAHLDYVDWCLLLTGITLVWLAEIFNTALEFLTDLVSPEYHPLARNVKDVGAGGTLVAVIFSLLIAALVFGTKLLFR